MDRWSVAKCVAWLAWYGEEECPLGAAVDGIGRSGLGALVVADWLVHLLPAVADDVAVGGVELDEVCAAVGEVGGGHG